MFNLIKSSCEIPWRSPWEYQNVPHILITRFFILPCNKMFSYKSAIESKNEFISKWMQNWPRDSKKLLLPIIDFHETQNKPDQSLQTSWFPIYFNPLWLQENYAVCVIDFYFSIIKTKFQCILDRVFSQSRINHQNPDLNKLTNNVDINSTV